MAEAPLAHRNPHIRKSVCLFTMRPLAAVAVAASVALAGCALFASEPAIPDHIVVQASDAWWINGWSYNHTGAHQAEGSATIDVVASEGTGTVTGEIVHNGSTTSFEWIAFEGDPDSPSQDNGINQDFQEHGATGNGHDLVPELHAVTSGWGTANLSVDGEPLMNPFTGERAIPAHFMVTDTGIRDDGTRQVRLRDGSLYRPENASEGMNHPGDHEVHFIFDTGPAEHDNSHTEMGGTLTPSDPEASFSKEAGYVTSMVRAEVTVSSQRQAPSVGEVDITLSGTNRTYREGTLGGPQGAGNLTWWVTDGLDRPGENLTLTLSSDGTADWEASLTVYEPDRLFLHLLYEEATWSAGS